jgi:sensor histidine kinase YesM
MATVLESAVLFGFGLIMNCAPTRSVIATILTITIMQVINGTFQSMASIICPLVFQHSGFVTLILLMTTLLALVAIFLSYRNVAKFFYITKSPMNRYILILLLPIVFVLLVVQHIFGIYGQTLVLNSDGVRISPVVNDWEMFFIQLLAYFCLLAVLFAYRKLSDGFDMQLRNALLEQQAEIQQDYMQELNTRYEQTRSFRHDIKTHLTVLNSLLKQGKSEKASEYLNQLEFTSDSLSFPCHTGNAVIDMLLSNKLGLAQQKDIKVDCMVKIPQDSSIDAMDLCIVFSNAIDNAIKACSMITEGRRYLSLSAVQKGNFFMVEIENSRRKDKNQPEGSGIGLNNIVNVAEKYNGATSIESNSKYFKLNVLFVISLQSEST